MTEDGSVSLALGVALALVGGLFVETRVLTWRRWTAYFLPSFPLAQRLVPIPRPPRTEGRTPSVRWELAAPHLVRFWADPRDRATLTGLHGVVVLAAGRQGVELAVRWAPPWTPVFGAFWLAGLGVARGEAALTVPIAAAMLVGLFVVYGARARTVAAELRWSFLDEAGAGPSE